MVFGFEAKSPPKNDKSLPCFPPPDPPQQVTWLRSCPWGWQPSTRRVPTAHTALSQRPWLAPGRSKGSCCVSQESPCSVQ